MSGWYFAALVWFVAGITWATGGLLPGVFVLWVLAGAFAYLGIVEGRRQ